MSKKQVIKDVLFYVVNSMIGGIFGVSIAKGYDAIAVLAFIACSVNCYAKYLECSDD